MNLIEQLGGYEKAKAKQQELSKIAADPQLLLVGKIIKEIGEIEIALLEYRRQHNIFEVGDKVVLKRPDQFSEIYTYDAYSEKMDLHFFESESDYGHVALDRVRHATDAEIKAGKRLEVK
ncbi:hypothetical protein [Acinetobacter pragensis]|uniref:hypothetical protein n=1 Tax=Acinetobacter pragensis TaxID=1806892 RepID=UPI003340EFD6